MTEEKKVCEKECLICKRKLIEIKRDGKRVVIMCGECMYQEWR